MIELYCLRCFDDTFLRWYQEDILPLIDEGKFKRREIDNENCRLCGVRPACVQRIR